MRRAGVVALALLAAGATAWSAGVKAIEPPAPAPAVSLVRGDGTPLRLAELAGRVVVVDFWASWCAPCQRSFPLLDSLYRGRRERGLEVLAVNVDEERKPADDFLATRPHEMPVFFDPSGGVPKAFGVEAMPTTYVLDRQGRIRFRHEGFTRADGEALAREVDGLLSEEVSPATR